MMVAYGVPEIHQSLATAPLDIKEAIDWLIRIGGKDINGKGDNCSELKQVLKAAARDKYKGARQMDYINSLEWKVKPLVNELARFLGYLDSINGSGPIHIGGSGIGRRDGHAILQDVSIGDFLLCCKNEATCTSQCKCCSEGNVGDSKCDPNSCPIKKVLVSPITLIGMCGESGERYSNNSNDTAKICCILSFFIKCLSDNESLDHGLIRCQHCEDSRLHKNCHKECKCQHHDVITKLACRINCLIQLAATITTLYFNKNVPMCRTCQSCNACNPVTTSTNCQPCSECDSALKGNGEHCKYCRTGQCCEQNNGRNAACQSKCEKCPNCSIVRNAKAFWDMLDHVSYSCGKCTRCLSTSSTQERKKCRTCSVCPGDSCIGGCNNRKLFGSLIYEFLHFMVYNFADVATSLKANISRLKDDCCKHRSNKEECQCSNACCGRSTAGISDCKDCEHYCMCCVEKGKGCSCANKCSEKLELLLRPALSGYVSAYDYNIATWDTLCKEGSGKRNKCSEECTAECKCASSECPPEGCCTYCPKRQCAKTLCKVVPAIYRFFDYIKQNINSELENPYGINRSQWANALIDGDSQLGDLFRSCGFPSKRLQPRMGCELQAAGENASQGSCRRGNHKPGNLNKLIECLKKVDEKLRMVMIMSNLNSGRSMNYLKPTTVRDKLLWLCGLPYSDVYEELQRTFVASIPNGSSNLSMMQLTLHLCVFPFHIFEEGSQSVWQYISHGFAVPGSKQRLAYNKNLIQLLWDLYDTLYHVTCALTFMNIQCGISSQNCGWEECKFGKNVNVNGDADDTCKCQTGRCKGTCDHCTSVCNACRGKAKCVCCCPYCENRLDSCVCLARFIASNDTQGDHSSSFRNDRYGHMGYRMEFLRKAEMRGAMLYDCMSGLLIRDHTVFPRLLECLLIARAGVPENLSDYYALFLSMGMKFELESHHNGVPDKALTAVFKSSMANTFLGAHDGILEPVVIALRHLYNQDSRKYNGASMIHNEAATHNASDFMSLYGCYYGSGCVGYMNALSLAMYQVDSRYAYNGVTHSANLFPNWVLCGATKFYIGMRQLAEDVSALECCREPGTCTCESTHHHICICEARCNCACVKSGSNCNCRSITHCRFVHPLLYSSGITFHEPDTWSYPKRKCMDFSKTLNRIIGPDSMLCRLMEAIENFLWQIRLPFCIALLTLWATALCFLMYVFIGHLDTLGIRSRWLLPRQLAHPLQLVMNTKVKPMGSGVGVI